MRTEFRAAIDLSRLPHARTHDRISRFALALLDRTFPRSPGELENFRPRLISATLCIHLNLFLPVEIMKTTAFLLAILSASEALLCYQGRYNASDPVKGSPLVCLGDSVSCVTGFDIKENIAVRFCDTSNCMVSTVPFFCIFLSKSSLSSDDLAKYQTCNLSSFRKI